MPLILLALGLVITISAAPNESHKLPRDEINEITAKPRYKIDPNLRRALLKALEELEQQEKDEGDDNNNEEDDENDGNDNENETLEKTTKTPIKYDLHTFGGNVPVINSTIILPTDGRIASVHYSEGDSEIKAQPDSEKILLKTYSVENSETLSTSASSAASGQQNSVFKPINVLDEEDLFVSKNIKSRANTQSSLNSIQSFEKSQTARESTTTTSKPSLNSTDDSSTEKATDVQFFSAPLVAAFTVLQDENGQPKKVEPIYKDLGTSVPITTDQLLQIDRKKQQEEYEKRQFQIQQEISLRNQQNFLETQRQLERQILELQQQAKQREELLKQQQTLQELQYLQQQFNQQRLPLVQPQLSREQQPPFVTSQTFQNNNFLATSSNRPSSSNTNNGNTLVSLQSSIQLPPNNVPVDFNSGLSAQQLPVKPAVNFLNSPFAASSFNAVQQAPLNINRGNSFQPAAVTSSTNNFQQFPSLNRPQRQEFATGNFGLNNPSTSSGTLFDASRSIETAAFFLPPTPQNARFQRTTSDAQLKHLLLNAGIVQGRNQEDLSIIAKVLSLNHDSPTLRFASSSPIAQRVKAPVTAAIERIETEKN